MLNDSFINDYKLYIIMAGHIFVNAESFNIKIHIKEWTRITQVTITCIDYILSNIECSLIVECKVRNVNFSDHSAQLLKIKYKNILIELFVIKKEYFLKSKLYISRKI